MKILKLSKETIEKSLSSNKHLQITIINFLVNNKHLIQELRDNNFEEFEFPTYAFLPKKISNKMSPDLVDAFQYCIHLLPNHVDQFKKDVKIKIKELTWKLL